MTKTDTEAPPVALQFFKALGDESRLKMAGLLASREYGVEELAAALNLRPPTVSHHLGVLRRIGLVQVRPEGTTRYYRLDFDALRRMHHETRPEKITVVDDADAGAAWERKVLRDFFDGERLKEIPASRKKRMVILAWLADRFDRDRRYPEAELNAIIARHHADTATLRREMIGTGLMARADGVYWRLDNPCPATEQHAHAESWRQQ